MSNTYNIFISHRGIDDEHVQRLKQRLRNRGNIVRNSSIDSTKYQDRIPRDPVIARYLQIGVKWAGTFICLIGEDTHNSKWVNYEIEQAHLQGKRIVGIYKYGCIDSVELPAAFKHYGGPLIGWNSLHKLQDIMDGNIAPVERPDTTNRPPIFNIKRIC